MLQVFLVTLHISCNVAGVSCNVARILCNVACVSCNVAGVLCNVARVSCNITGNITGRGTVNSSPLPMILVTET